MTKKEYLNKLESDMTKNTRLTLDQLKSGDVLVMQGAQHVSWKKIIENKDLDAALIQAIMWLTNSDVCHGAIYYGHYEEKYRLIDDGTKGVAQHIIDQKNALGDYWYVRRMESGKSLDPVLNIAMKYTKLSTAYDWELLTLLGLLLIYKKLTPNTKFYLSLLSLLKKLVVSLDAFTHEKPVNYFVCSQFVATCFNQAGVDYNLQVENGNLELENKIEQNSLIDLCLDNIELASDDTKNLLSDKELSAADLKIFLDNISTSEIESTHSIDTPTINICDQFLQLFFKINSKALNISSNQYNTLEKRIKLAKKFQAIFVTPADLKNHCTNLTPIGKIQFIY